MHQIRFRLGLLGELTAREEGKGKWDGEGKGGVMAFFVGGWTP